MRHKEEIKLWADCEEETVVWSRRKNEYSWERVRYPKWINECEYVVDNDYADLRMAAIDGKDIFILTEDGEDSIKLSEPNFTRPPGDYSIGKFPEKKWQWLYINEAGHYCTTVHYTKKEAYMVLPKSKKAKKIDESMKEIRISDASEVYPRCWEE